MTLQNLQERWRNFAESDRGRLFVKVVRGAFVAAILGVLVYQVSKVGWTRVLTSLPTQPAFYGLVLAMYFLLPATESLVYGRLWGLPPLRCLGVMIRKRVLNVDVVGYSGEVYLFLWARDRIEKPRREIMGAIKDNLIVSSGSSLLAASLLIGGLLLTRTIDLERFVSMPGRYYAGLGALAILFAGAVVYRFRRVIFTYSRRVLAALTAAHVGRFLAGYVLQVAAWWVVIPTASFETWAVLLVLFVVINRIPFLPSSDLVFVSAGAGLTPLLDVPVAPIVGMLLVRSAADRLLNLVFFTASVLWRRQQVSTREDPKDVDIWTVEAEEDAAAEATASPLNT